MNRLALIAALALCLPLTARADDAEGRGLHESLDALLFGHVFLFLTMGSHKDTKNRFLKNFVVSLYVCGDLSIQLSS